MATLQDVRRIAMALPDVVECDDRFGFAVLAKDKPKAFVYTWNERVQPKKPRVPNPGVLVAMVRDLDIKEILLASGADKIFTEPHYNGFPAILIRLDAIDLEELEDHIVEAWRCKAPKELIARLAPK